MKKIILLFLIYIFCAGSHVNAQWTESFEGAGTPTGWAVINGGDANGWVFGEQMMPAQDGLQYAYIQYTFGTAHDDYLITPAINVTAGLNDRFGFYAANFDATYSDEFNVLISTTGTASGDFTKIDGPIEPPTMWTKYSYDLSAYTGQNIYIAIQAISTDKYFLYIDNAVLDAIPSCTKPTDLAVSSIGTDSAVLNWTATGNVNSWDIKLGLAGFDPASTSPIATIDNIYTANGLTEGVDYEFYVRADCGEGDLSTWSEPYAFTTECAPSGDFSENFDSILIIDDNPILPDCWGSIVPTDAIVTVGTTEGNDSNALIIGNEAPSVSDVFAIAPPMNALAAGTHQLRFRAKTIGVLGT